MPPNDRQDNANRPWQWDCPQGLGRGQPGETALCGTIRCNTRDNRLGKKVDWDAGEPAIEAEFAHLEAVATKIAANPK